MHLFSPRDLMYAGIVALVLGLQVWQPGAARYRACIENRRSAFVASTETWARGLAKAESDYAAKTITNATYHAQRTGLFRAYLSGIDAYDKMICS